MKFKLILLSVVILSVFSCNNKGGMSLEENANKGNSYSFGDPALTKSIIDLAAAYTSQDTEKLLSYYDDSFNSEEETAWTKKWLESMNSISMKPYKIIPLSMNGEDQQVLAWSKEERDYKNGSYEKLDLMELFVINKEGKVKGFKQWKSIDSVNFGRATGGKFFGKKPGENSGRPFMFSNRNETQMLETMIGHYNKMEIKEVSSFFAEQITINDYEGKVIKIGNKDLGAMFSDFRSVKWTPYSIVPIKIANTDAASGVMVFSNERRVLKSGKIWEKELMEMIYFDLDGKISSLNQFAK